MSEKKHQYNYGLGTVRVESAFDHLEADRHFNATTALRIKQTIESDEFRPPILPEVALSLSQMASSADVSMGEVERTVSRDPAVAARVLSVANSAFYSRGTAVRSLRGAIVKLGLSELRDIAFQIVAQTHIFRVPGYTDRMRELFDAAQATGLLAREICRLLRFESETAYLCGLLHDMGEAIILGIVGEPQRKKRAAVISIERLCTVLDDYHCQAGSRVCDLWGLSPIIADAVRHHHQPERSKDPSQMALVVAVADAMVAHAGIATEPKRIQPLDEPRFYQLNLSPDQVQHLLDYADQLADDSVALTGLN